jgi:hypothetical protein
MSRCTKGQDLKKEILNATGLKARDISVRYDGSYHVNVKTIYPLSEIEEIANKKESYQRDEATGEILCGGNTFVFVKYDYDFKLPDEMRNTILSLKGIMKDPTYFPVSTQKRYYADLLSVELDMSSDDCMDILNIDRHIINQLLG